MTSIATDIFLSCSFDEKDADIVNLIKSICHALDVNCVNADKGYGEIPASIIREYIQTLPAIIAIATRRQGIEHGKYAMPPAVRDEISMAYGMSKPILLISESDVQLDGFMKNYGTALTFSRAEAWSTKFIEKLVASIYIFKNNLRNEPIAFIPYNPDYYTELASGLIELEKTDDGFTWACTFTRRIVFCNDFKGMLRLEIRPEKLKAGFSEFPDLEWQLSYESGSKPFVLHPVVNQISAAFLDLSIQISPQPEEKDVVEFTLYTKSAFLFSIYMDETCTPVTIKDRVYYAFAGMIRSIRTDLLRLQYRFPKEYDLSVKDISCLVARYSSNVEYVVVSEINRIVTTIDSFGGNIVVNLIATKPLLGCMYGIAWIPPAEPPGVNEIQPEALSSN